MSSSSLFLRSRIVSNLSRNNEKFFNHNSLSTNHPIAAVISTLSPANGDTVKSSDFTTGDEVLNRRGDTMSRKSGRAPSVGGIKLRSLKSRPLWGAAVVDGILEALDPSLFVE
ncbi:hypothetical protein ACFE04_010463 [Oxalis oulophora]